VKTNPSEVTSIVDERKNLFEQLENQLANGKPAARERAFLISCDLLFLFSPSFRETETSALAYTASKTFVETLGSYFKKEMQHFSASSNGANPQSLSEEELHLQTLIEAIVRPLATERISTINLVPTILVHLSESSKFLTDIIKFMLNKLRERKAEDEWEIMLNTLKLVSLHLCELTNKLLQKFNDYVGAAEDEEKESEMQKFKELALRLSQFYAFLGRFEDQLKTSLQRFVENAFEYVVTDAKVSNLPNEVRFQFLAEGVNKFVSRMDIREAQKAYVS
jgi:hypothetical protein